MGGVYNRDGGAESSYKLLSENVKIGDVLGDSNIDFVDENELTFQKCFVMV